jgi:hypothetical protein
LAAASDANARISFGIAGPVGIVAVAIGLGGLVIGLLRRHHRRTRPLPQPPAATPEPVAPSRVP